MINGNPDGEWQLWFSNGSLCESRYYKNGIEAGTWIRYNIRGDTANMLEFSNGKLVKEGGLKIESQLNCFYGIYNSICMTITKYENDLLSHELISNIQTYMLNVPNDTLIHTEINEYRNDTILRTEFLAHDKTILLVSTKYSFPLTSSYYTTTHWNKDKVIIRKEISSPVRDSIWDSTWYDNGKIKMSSLVVLKPYRYTSGGTISKSYGQLVYYYPNGNIQRKCEASMGLPDGKEQLYNENGELIEEREYAEGRLIKSVKIDPGGK